MMSSFSPFISFILVLSAVVSIVIWPNNLERGKFKIQIQMAKKCGAKENVKSDENSMGAAAANLCIRVSVVVRDLKSDITL